MGRCGRREGSGRKRLGKDVRVKIDESVLNQINNYAQGTTQSDRVRNCILIGLALLKQEGNETNE